MGIVQKQGIQNALILYTGVFLGAFNKYVLFSRILGGEKMGLADVLLFVALILAQLSKLGSGSILIRFFPYFLRHNEKQSSFYFLNLVVYPLLGFILFSGLIFIFKAPFLAHFSEKSPLFTHYYFYIFPLTLGYTLFSSFFSFSQGHLKTVVPVAIQEVGVRLWQATAVLMFYFNIIDFERFLWLYCLTYWVNGFVLIAYLAWLKRLNLRFDISLIGTKLNKVMWRIGWVSFFSRAAEVIKDNLTGIQLAALLGLNETALYSLSAFIALMIYIPARAMGNVALPIIIRRIQERNFAEIESIYQKSALNGLIIGMLILIGIVINLAYMITFLPSNRFHQLEAIIPLTIWLAIARVFDVANGVNAAIVEYAKKTYTYTFFTNLLMILMIFLFTEFFVNTWGIVGAGIATASAMLVYNCMNTLIVWKFYRIQPFTKATLYPIVIGLGLLGLHFLFPVKSPSLLDSIIRSTLGITIYLFAIYKLQVSENINQMVVNFLQRIKK